EYKDGLMEGLWEYQYWGGEKWKSGHYAQGKKTGVWTFWFENGKKLMEGAFKQDEEEGVWQSWYETGKLKDQGSYSGGKMSGKWEGWYPNGVKNYEGQWAILSKSSKFFDQQAKLTPLDGVSYPVAASDEVRTATWKFWNERGKLQQLVTYNAEGVMNGPSETYTPNGFLESRGNYKLAKPEGKWEYYQDSGAPLRTCAYKNGKMHGKSVTYGRNGRVSEEATYKNGKMEGEYIQYDEKTGKVKQRAIFRDGRIVEQKEGMPGK
ncbi:MAG: hypothetical protein RL220_421, partial [Bacteroidota bacterium]